MALKTALLASFVAAMLAAPAMAQTTTPQTDNDQNQYGDVTATMTVDSRGQSTGTNSGISSSATAVGNTASAANLTGPLRLRSRQTFSGAAISNSTALADDACCYAVSVATAQGNAIEAQSVGGATAHDIVQTADGGDVSATAQANIRMTSQLSVVASSALNNAATRHENGTQDVAVTQTASASAYSAVDADACCTGATVAAASSSINAWSGEASTATTRAVVTQASTGTNSRATVDSYQVQAAGDMTAAASAAANSATLASEFGYADLRARQTSSTNVAADTRLSAGTFNGAAVASAYGVGNSVLATNVGSDLQVDIGQINTGGVSADAQFTGGTGGVASGTAIVTSAAIGNAATTWVCSYCGDSSAYGTVVQNNGGNITSTGTITATGAIGAIGSASAVGNSATYVTTSRQN
jgi:hypothetical protein